MRSEALQSLRGSRKECGGGGVCGSRAGGVWDSAECQPEMPTPRRAMAEKQETRAVETPTARQRLNKPSITVAEARSTSGDLATRAVLHTYVYTPVAAMPAGGWRWRSHSA